MGLLATLSAYRRVLARPRRERLPETARLLTRRPGIAFGVGAFESGLMVSGRVPERVKSLAAIKTSALIGCPF